MARESSSSRRARVKLQLRDSKGRWIEMGGSVKWYSSKLKRDVSGIVTGSKGHNIYVKLNSSRTKDQTVSVPAHTVENVQNKATLGQDPAVSGLLKGTDDLLNQAHQNSAQPAAAPIAGLPEDYKTAVTSDGLLYAGRKDDQELYSPAKELEIGDTLMSPVGTDPSKPYSIGKSWNRRGVEAFDPEGTGIGEVVAVQADSHVTVQLPEGNTAPDGTDTVTVGIENDVIKASPGLTEAFEGASGVTPNDSVVDDAALEPDVAPTAEPAPEEPVASAEEVAAPEEEHEPATKADTITLAIQKIKAALLQADNSGLSGTQLAQAADDNRFNFVGASGEKFMLSPSRDFDGNWSLDLTDSSGEQKGSYALKDHPANISQEAHNAANPPGTKNNGEFDNTFDGLFNENGFTLQEQKDYDTAESVAANSSDSSVVAAYAAKKVALEATRDKRIELQKAAIAAAPSINETDLSKPFAPVIMPVAETGFKDTTKILVGDSLLLDLDGNIAEHFSDSPTPFKTFNGESVKVIEIDPILGTNPTSMGKPVGMNFEVQHADGETSTHSMYAVAGKGNSKRGIFLDNKQFRMAMRKYLIGGAEPKIGERVRPDGSVAEINHDNTLPGLSTEEKARVHELEKQIADIYANKTDGDVESLENELDALYEKEDEGEATTEEAPQDTPVPEEATEAESAPEPAPVVEAEPATSVETAPSEPKTDGKSLIGADGTQIYEGSKVTHPTNGPGTVQKIIAGKTAKIVFDSGIVKIAQANKISSQSDTPAAPIDVSSMSPGESAINPANGKLFIVGSDGSAISTGDKVSAPHKGETKSGTVKGIYKGTSSVAIVFDGETKPSTKKATATTSLETPNDAPTAPVTDQPTQEAAPETAVEAEEAPATPAPEDVVEAPEEAPTGEATPEPEAPTEVEDTPAVEEVPEEEAAPAAETDAEEAPDSNESEVISDEVSDEPAPRRREFITPEVREEVLDNLQPIDTSNWKNVTQEWKSQGNSTGSNPGGVFEDENGKRWYVKKSKSDAHARAETLASQLYVMAGVDTPALRLVDFDGKLGTASPMLEGAKSDLGSKFSDKEYMGKIQEGFAVDAWLANWDVLGLEDDNIVTDAEGNPVRIDTGGAMMFRAQGGLKNNIQAGAWGNEVKDWEGLQTKGEAQKAFGNLTDAQKKDSAARVESVTPDQIDEMVDGLGYTGPEAEELKSILKARRDDIIAQAASIPEAGETVPESSDPVSAPEFPAVPAYNDLTGYTIKQNASGVYYPEENLPPAVLSGIKNGTITLPNLPFITRNTKSGDVHYYDLDGVRHWGQYGAEGALMRRKNAAGEFEYLLVQRDSSLSTGGGMWSVPGGAHKSQEDSENAGATASTELSEELGMDAVGSPVANFKDVSTSDWVYNYAIYDAPDMDDEDLKIDRFEISDHKWMSPAEIKELSDNGKLYESMSNALEDIFDVSDSTPEAEKTATAKAAPGSTVTLSSDNGGTEFKKMGGNKWSLFVGGTDTGIKATNSQIQDISGNSGLDIVDGSVVPQEVETPADDVEAPDVSAEVPDTEGREDGAWQVDDVLVEASEAQLSNIPVGATIKVYGYDHYTDYTKVTNEGNDWKNSLGDEVSSYDLADGDSYIITSLVSDESGLTVPEKPETAPITFDDSDLEDLGIFEDSNTDLIPGTKIVSVGDEIFDSTPEIIDSLPVGTSISKMFGGEKKTYTKTLDALAGGDSVWENEDGYKVLSNLFAQNGDFTVEAIAGGPSTPAEDDSVDIGVDTSKALPNASVADLDNLPAGTVISHKDGDTVEEYKKIEDLYNGGYLWQSNYSQYPSQGLADGSDYEIVSLGGTSTSFAFTPENTVLLSTLTPEDFDNLAVGSKIVYNDGETEESLVGFYQKNTNGMWEYTPAGATSSTGSELASSTFHSLFEASADLAHKFLVVGKDGALVVDENPQPVGPEKSVQTGVPLVHNPEILMGLPLGSTVKQEKYFLNSYDTNSYFVKTAENVWTKFTKTAHKLMNHGETSEKALVNSMYSASISKPLSENHFVTYLGEIGYAGDVVTIDGEKFTVEKVLKNHINLVNSEGVKSKGKGSQSVIDPDFGKLVDASPSGQDPVSEADAAFKKAEKKKADAAAKIEKEANAVKNFAGASADDYNELGLVMPSVTAPNLSKGIVYAPIGAPDLTNPLYGAPKPVKPIAPGDTFVPVQLALPTWDSASWLEKVKQRYLDNPGKAKATLQESNNWGKVQTVLAGSTDNLDSLLSSMYLDDDLYTEAKAGIEAQEKSNESLVKAHAAKVAEDEKLFSTDKAKLTAKYIRDATIYAKDLIDWTDANPAEDGQEAVTLPETSIETFIGDIPDWTKAPVGTHSLDTVVSSIQADKALGAHGISVAVDSDQVEDLDMKVTRVLTAKGVDSFEVKFKMTAPHGNVAELLIGNKDGVEIGNGIYPSHMVLDSESGLLKDSGKPEHVFVKDGKRYVYTDSDTGAVVTFQRTTDTGININSNNNTVKIHLPIGSSAEDLQKTLTNLGITNSRPSTQGDIRVLAENKLLSMMGEEIGDVKTYDGRENLGGELRAQSLAKIKSKYGVGPEDMTFVSESNGRIRFHFSDEFAEAQTKKYNVGTFFHSVKGSNDADRWFSMLAGPKPGLLSTYHRFTEGVGGKGKSSATDMSQGSSDYIYLTPNKVVSKTATSEGVYVKPQSIFKRSDFWANAGDGYGSKGPQDNGSGKSPYAMFDQRGVNYGEGGGGMYEVLPKDSVSVADWSHVVVNWQVRDTLIERLKKAGMLYINGVPVEDFVLKQGMDLPVNLTPPSSV